MASSIVLPVPRELAINTNHPNAQSVTIDSTSSRPALRQTRSQNKAVLEIMSNDNVNESPGERTTHPIRIKLNIRSGAKRDHDLVSEDNQTGSVDHNHELPGNARPKKKVRSSPVINSNGPVSESTPALAGCVSLSSSSSLSSCPLSSPEESPSVRQPKLRQTSKRKNLPNRRVSSSQHLSQTKNRPVAQCAELNCTNAQSVDVNFANSRAAVVNPQNKETSNSKPRTSSISTIHGDARTSSSRIAARRKSASKSAKRIALENHLRRHDSYGNVRLYSDAGSMPANSAWDLEIIEGMIQNESLMQRIEVIHDEHQKRMKSEKKLWELGKSMPWVLDMFKTIEEYQTWMRNGERRRVKWAQERQDRKTRARQHTGDTTEEEDSESGDSEDSDISEFDLEDAADADAAAAGLMALNRLDAQSTASARGKEDTRSAADTLVSLTFTSPSILRNPASRESV